MTTIKNTLLAIVACLLIGLTLANDDTCGTGPTTLANDDTCGTGPKTLANDDTCGTGPKTLANDDTCGPPRRSPMTTPVAPGQDARQRRHLWHRA